jgi:pimeloyl-ACP methyl ester carboxylesterase
MPFLEINGKNIYYNINGEGENLILLHDGFFNTASWDGVRKELAKHFRVIDYDRFGYGKSDHYTEKFDGDIIGFYADELERFTDELGLEKFNLCGHCLGGAIALVYAASHPERVGKIIAESVGYFSDLKLLMKSDITFKPFSEMHKPLKKNLIKMNGEEYAGFFWECIYEYKKSYIMAEDYSILNEVKKVESPVLIINGDRDFYFDVEHPLKAYKTFKNAELWIVPRCGHTPHIEKKDDFVRNTVNFLKKTISDE